MRTSVHSFPLSSLSPLPPSNLDPPSTTSAGQLEGYRVKGEEGNRKGEGRWVAYNTRQKFASPRVVQSVPKAHVHLFYFGLTPEQYAGELITEKRREKEKYTLSWLIYLTAISPLLWPRARICVLSDGTERERRGGEG